MTAARELAVARFLAAQGAPVAAPLAEAGPHQLADGVVTLWPWIDHDRVAGDDDAELAGATLAALHRAFAGYDGALPPYTDALDGVALLLADPTAVPVLAGDDRLLLNAQFARLRAATGGADAWTPIHGDAHPGNLLLGGVGPVWVDCEDACLGPAEYDIACLPSSAWPRFTEADQALIAGFAALRSVCVATWCAARPADGDAREALAHHLTEVRGFPA